MKKATINRSLTVAIVIIIMLILASFTYSMSFLGAAYAIGDNVNILVLGQDEAAGLCDVIMLVSINFDAGEICIAQIPRDTYYNYTQSSYKKINGALNHFGSIDSLVNNLKKDLSIDVDYYLCINLETIEAMVDMISGIEVYVPKDMIYTDEAQGLSINIKAGKQTLNGSQAIGFLRYRAGYVRGDLDRIDAQKIFCNAFFSKVSKLKNPMLIFNLYRVVSSKSQTNVNEKTVFDLLGKSTSKKTFKTYYMTLPGEAVQSENSGAWYYILSRSATAQLLKKHFGMKKDENDFDIDNKFVDNQVKSFYDIYKSHCEYKIYSANELNNNQLNIN